MRVTLPGGAWGPSAGSTFSLKTSTVSQASLYRIRTGRYSPWPLDKEFGQVQQKGFAAGEAIVALIPPRGLETGNRLRPFHLECGKPRQPPQAAPTHPARGSRCKVHSDPSGVRCRESPVFGAGISGQGTYQVRKISFFPPGPPAFSSQIFFSFLPSVILSWILSSPLLEASTFKASTVRVGPWGC